MKILVNMDELLLKEEILWKQRSRLDTMKEGDQHMDYFKRKAFWKAKKNNILAIKRIDGPLTKNMEEIKDITNSFCKKLYSSNDMVDPFRIIHLVRPLVTEDMNVDLCKQFSDQEISDALFQIRSFKAPGPDGFPARFF